jgi:hypothetical protein
LSRSAVTFNFGFYRPKKKVKTKIKRYLGRALPKAPSFRKRTKHRVSLTAIPEKLTFDSLLRSYCIWGFQEFSLGFDIFTTEINF